MTEQTGCLNCKRDYSSTDPLAPHRDSDIDPANRTVRPFIELDQNGIGRIPGITGPSESLGQQRFALIDNQKDTSNPPTVDSIQGAYHRVWDMTKVRDMEICGFYLQGPGPSFFQRMVGPPQTAFSYSNSVLGLETFVAGGWAGGSLVTPDAYRHSEDDRPRLDRDFYSSKDTSAFSGTTSLVEGMPGCKSFEMCSTNNASDIGIGHFRLTNSDIGRFGLNCTIPDHAKRSGECG